MSDNSIEKKNENTNKPLSSIPSDTLSDEQLKELGIVIKGKK